MVNILGLQQKGSPPGSPSHTSSQSYLQSPSPPGRGSFSRSKVRKVRVTSMLGGTTMIKEHSRLWGYLSGKPGDSMRPEGLVKFREQSEPEGEGQKRNGYKKEWHWSYCYGERLSRFEVFHQNCRFVVILAISGLNKSNWLVWDKPEKLVQGGESDMSWVVFLWEALCIIIQLRVHTCTQNNLG